MNNSDQNEEKPVKRGKWLHERTDPDPWYDICDQCGAVYQHMAHRHYCHKCGAEMEGWIDDKR